MPNIPNCKNCEDESRIKKFNGFYQECYGLRRFINIDGTLTDYIETPEASQKKAIRCIFCKWTPETHKMNLWAQNYEWPWPDKQPAVSFDAKDISDKLMQFYKKLGSEAVRITIKKSDIKYDLFPQQVDSRVISLFNEKLKIDKLYSYQTEAINSLMKNRITVVQAPTGAGKSLIYQIYYLNALLKDKRVRLLALFPTQALTKDQSRAFIRLSKNNDTNIPQLLQTEAFQFSVAKENVSLALFCGKDGDTGRQNSTQELLKQLKDIHILFGTPDKLYVHLYKEQFTPFLKDLELIVIDEAHMATGIFGGNFAYLIRRLLKLAPKAKMLIMSATFSNVEEFTKELCGEQVVLIDGSNTIKNNRELLLIPLWPYKKKVKSGETVDPATAVLDTVAKIIEFNGKEVPSGIVFGRSKRGLSWLLRLMEKRINEGKYPLSLSKLPNIFKRDLKATIKDELLQQMHDREISIMFSTNALELGIDVGDIDFVILDSLPDSDLSFLQRIGRAGRSRDGLAIAFIERDPYQQFWLSNISRSRKVDIDNVKPLPIAISNPNIIRNNYIRYAWEAKTHLSANINEVKRTVNEWSIKASGVGLGQILSESFKKDSKELSDFMYVEKLIRDPIKNNLVAMRVAVNVAEVNIVDKNTNKEKGSISLGNFFRDLHENAVWTDENGTPFKVIGFDEEDKESGIPRKAIVVTENNKDRRTYGVVKVRQTDEIEGVPPKELAKGNDYYIKYGPYKIEEKSPGYYETIADKSKFIQYDQDSKMNVIRRPKYDTLGIVIHNDKWKQEMPVDTDTAALIGFLTIFQNIASHHVGASEEDIKYDYSSTTGNIYILDSSAGGNGVSLQIAKDLTAILKICIKIIGDCKCKNGCFGCIWPKYSDIDHTAFSKKRTIEIIKWLLGASNRVNI